ncbi:hypothetical protein KLP28_14685 [Nocardioidaceae bacterium]|nr:hypothetical protein KLP28_14685 [Nocardioidaceae bacterium]
MRRLVPWATTVLGSSVAATVLVALAATVGDAEAVVAVCVAMAMLLVVAAFSLPVLAAMGLAPHLAFLVALSTYVLQVLLGALLLREGGPGGALDGVLDARWLGVALVVLAVVATVGVVTDQLRAARAG